MDINLGIIFGGGTKYSNNLEIFFDDATIHIDKFFSKDKKESITVKTFAQNNKFIKFKPVDQFRLMFDKIRKNYQKDNSDLINYRDKHYQSGMNLLNLFKQQK